MSTRTRQTARGSRVVGRLAAGLFLLELALGPGAGCARGRDSDGSAGTAGSTGNSGDTGAKALRGGSAVAPLSSASYRLEWIPGRAALDPAGKGWSVVNDRGTRVTVARGWLTTFSVQLVPCSSAPASGSAPSTRPASGGRDAGGSPSADRPAGSLGWLEMRLPSLFSPGVALAGHSSQLDPSAVKRPRIESMHSPLPVSFDGVRFPAAAYCQVHYLVARANLETDGLPKEVDMERVSLHLEGTWRAADGQEKPFTVHTGVAHGRLFDLEPGQGGGGAAGAGSHLEVFIRRDLGTLFDGVDFATQNDAAVARQILKNLIDGTSIQTHRSGGHE